MGYSVKATGYYGDNWLMESINASIEKQGGKVVVICKQSEAAVIKDNLATATNSKLYFITGVNDYMSLIERICGAEMSICYMSQTLMERCGLEGQRYIFSRMRNQGWCSGEIIYFSESDLAKVGL
jgi:phosphoribosyl-AMP cyclohydrolase